MRFIAIAFALVLSACSTVDATIDGTGGIIKGVGSDVFGVTAGILDVTSNVIKDVADKTGTAATAPEGE
jgi:phage-related protein